MRAPATPAALIAFAVLLCFCALGAPTLHAQTVDRDTAACNAGRYFPPYSLYEELEKYSIKAKSNPPNRIFNPGETYEISYNIETTCVWNCGKVRQHTLSHRAVLGADRIKIQTGTFTTLGASTIARHDCGGAHARKLTFTVPSPKTLGAQGQEVETVTMGVCPSTYNCAGHTIRVRNGSLSGWKVSILKPLQRAIGAGVNRVAPNQRITLSATVTRPNAWPTSGPAPTIEIRQISSTTGPVSAGPLSPKPATGFGNSNSAQIRFALRPHPPGVYSYKACLTGLKQGNWPAPDVCGPPTAITVGAASLASWQVGAVQVNKLGALSSSTTAYEPFKVQTTIKNISKVDNPTSGRIIIVLVRAQGGSGVPSRIFGEVGSIGAGQTINKLLQSRKRVPGTYEFKACIAESRTAAMHDMVCGPWSSITIGAAKVRPAPQPVAPVVNTCTGGRSKNAQGRCVCPAGSSWNPNRGFQRCYTCEGGRDWNVNQKRCVCPSGTKWNPRDNKCAAVIPACTGGRVYDRSQGKCICEGDLFWNPGLKRCYECTGGRNWNARSNRCVCPSGTKWNSRGKQCAPLGIQVPGAVKPKKNLDKLQCIGGKVRGTLCWCGLGKFPKKISKSVYRCR